MKKPFKTVKMNRFVRVRKIMQEYGLPMNSVMCGKLVDNKFFLTNRTK